MMKALLIKEIRQGKLFFFFGIGFALALIILSGVLSLWFTQFSWPEISGALFLVGLIGTVFLALIAGAGLFAGEVDRGTLPLLLGLPISRPRIWVAKILSGLILGLTSSAVLLLLLGLVFRAHFSEQLQPGQWKYLIGNGLMLWLSAFSLGSLISLLREPVISALMVTVLAFAGLAVLAVMTVFRWGGGLTGWGVWTDSLLWGSALLPAILAAGLFTFIKGELLWGRRKWLVALPVFLLLSGCSILALSGSVRWALRYSRPGVEAVYPPEADWNGKNIALVALRSPCREITLYRHNWRAFPRIDDSYRSRNLVLLDLASGREEQVIPSGFCGAVSPDGKRAALARPSAALTWWEIEMGLAGGEKFEILDLPSGKSRVCFNPKKQWGTDQGYLYRISWSPGGSWLACNTFISRFPYDGLLLSSPEGGKVRKIGLLMLDGWAWEASGRGIYYFDPSLRLIFSPLPSGEEQVLWQGATILPKFDPNRVRYIGMATSPDGRWLALQLSVRVLDKGEKDRPEYYRDRLWTYVISREGRQVYVLQQQQGASSRENMAASKPIWSADSSRLYYLSGRMTAISGEFELWLWRVGDKTPRVSSLPSFTENKLPAIAFRPETDDLLIWDKKGVLVADRQGKISPFPNDKVTALAKDHDLLGIDQAGRAIVLELPIGNHNSIGAVDLTTGELKQLYP
jgi:hypothetical protein